MQQKPQKEDFDFPSNLPDDSILNNVLEANRNHVSSKRRSSIISSKSNNYADDDMQSISTVSGSGMNFFRNVVRKHGTKAKESSKAKTKEGKENIKTSKDGKNKKDSECKDCESQFRQKVFVFCSINVTQGFVHSQNLS